MNDWIKELTKEEKYSILENIVRDYIELLKYKGIKAGIEVEPHQLVLDRNKKRTIFNIENRTISGYEDAVSEDMRDYLRRRGVKIFTGKNFKSI